LAPRADRLRAAIRLLWSMYTSPHFPAVIELFTAARSDEELRAHLGPIAARHQRNVHRLAREYFPDALRLGGRFDATLALILDAMQGMASSDVQRGPVSVAARLALLHDIAAAALAPAGTTENA
jgi:hypothetical protein